MSLNIAVLTVIMMEIIFANMPFISERFFGVIPIKRGRVKLFWQRLLEWAILGLIAFGIAQFLEAHINLTPYPQTGEFFWVLVITHVTLAFPGFAYRYLWLKSSSSSLEPLIENEGL